MYIKTTIVSTGYCGTVEMLSTRDADNKHDKHAMATTGYRCIAEHFPLRTISTIYGGLKGRALR